MAVKISQLIDEMVARVQESPTFTGKGFSVFSLEDLQQQTEMLQLPAVGIAYYGSKVKENSVDARASSATSVAFITVTFAVIVEVEYRAGGTDDTKKWATDLLDEVRGLLLGYKNANLRPWRLVDEAPAGEGDGVIFYAQLWETDLPALGTFQQP